MTKTPPLRVGMIGLDTSHAPSFARLLNQPADPEHIPGAPVVAAFPGGSPDFERSAARVDRFTREIADEHGVAILDSPEAVAEASDLLLITAVDGRTHPDLLRRTLPMKRPTFIDKPMALGSAQAAEMFRMAEQAGVPLMSSSSIRFAQSLAAALDQPDADSGEIVGCDVFGPMAEEPTQPGLYWYGIHGVEAIYTVMGPGCREVRATTNEGFDLISAVWSHGRMASLRGHRRGHHHYGVTIHREKRYQQVDPKSGQRSWYASLLDTVLDSLPRGRSAVAAAETMEVMRFIEAANESRQTGRAVAI